MKKISRSNPKKPTPAARMRSGKMPVTLINGTTAATAAPGIQAVAASIAAHRPCYAAQLQRIARALTEGVSEAQAVTNWTEKPVAGTILTERTLSERAVTEIVLTEFVWPDEVPPVEG